MQKSYNAVLVSLAAVLCLGLFTQAWGQAGKGRQARIEASNDYYYFGYMPTNAIVQHIYWLRNTGNDSLRIFKVKPGCGCTNAPLSKDVIGPGDSASVKIVFDSKNMTGKMVKEVEVFSNDPANAAITLRFFAMVNREHDFVRAEPNTLRFAKFGSKDGRMVRTFNIVNKYDAPVDIKLIEMPHSRFAIDKKTFHLKAGETTTITMEQLEPVPDESDVLTSLTFEFAGKETDRITIPIVAQLLRTNP